MPIFSALEQIGIVQISPVRMVSLVAAATRRRDPSGDIP
jgi:hypothetical protein